MEHWLCDVTKGLADDVPKLSRIFLWYAGDFQPSPAKFAGQERCGKRPSTHDKKLNPRRRPSRKNPTGQYAPQGKARAALLQDAALEYFEYDWNLNIQ